MSSKRIFIIAGENSGDLHGSNLVKAIRKMDSSIGFKGLGGPQLASAGVTLMMNIVEDFAIIGFWEILKNLSKFKKLFKGVVDELKNGNYSGIILIDYPEFNLKVARKAKKLGIPIIYYISPQIWAWRRGRRKEISNIVSKMLVVLPFEVKHYEGTGLDVEYVGHPLLDVIKLTMTKDVVCKKFNLDPNKLIIGLLPGSRKGEVERILPIMIATAELIKQKIPDAQFVLPRASTVSQDLIQLHLQNTSLNIMVVNEFRYNVRSILDFALVASGTATLESAFLKTPMVVIYKVSLLTWLIAKNLVTLPYIGLVNILAGDLIVPEFIQNDAKPTAIAKRVLKILNDPEELENIKFELAKVREKIGEPGASINAARAVLEVINRETKKEIQQNIQTTDNTEK